MKLQCNECGAIVEPGVECQCESTNRDPSVIKERLIERLLELTDVDLAQLVDHGQALVKYRHNARLSHGHAIAIVELLDNCLKTSYRIVWEEGDFDDEEA